MIEIKDRQLYIDGKPFLVRGAELQNSSLSSAQHMSELWEKLVAFNLNTVLGPVTWDQIEPEEGKFDFTEIDKVIKDARANGLKLVLLWFGSWKNGQSSYAPTWVKKNTDRFPRMDVNTRDGTRKVEVLAWHGKETLVADQKAFAKLMNHIKVYDQKHQTVIMMQVENEVGLLGDSRDRSFRASELFNQPVPTEFVQFIQNDWDNLHYTLKEHLDPKIQKKLLNENSSWPQFFGESVYTDELFMAYNYAKYVEEVAAIGKKEYNIPVFTNVWQNNSANGSTAAGGIYPGDYPTGGAVGQVLDVWLQFAPTLSFVSPDIYLSDYEERCQWYTHKNQPYFVPEQRRDDVGARHMWRAVGEYAAIGACPFGIDTLEIGNDWQSHYELLKKVEPFLLDARLKGRIVTGFYADEAKDDEDQAKLITSKIFEKYTLTIERARVYGRAAGAYGLVISTDDPDKFILVGAGFQVRARANDDARTAGIASFKEKHIVNGKMETLRFLNGDETQSGSVLCMPNFEPDYGTFPVAISIPAKTRIALGEFYVIDK